MVLHPASHSPTNQTACQPGKSLPSLSILRPLVVITLDVFTQLSSPFEVDVCPSVLQDESSHTTAEASLLLPRLTWVGVLRAAREAAAGVRENLAERGFEKNASVNHRTSIS